MIRQALALVPADNRHLIPAHLVAALISGIAAATACVILVPMLTNLLDGHTGAASLWLAGLAAAVVVAAISGYWQSMFGLRLGVGMLRGVTLRLGDHLSALPLGWFSGRDTASVSRVVVTDVREIVEFFSHLLSVLINGLVVPLGIAVGVLCVDWRLGVAMGVALPVLAGADALAARWYRSADQRLHHSAAEADSRVLEFTTAQPVLRAFGAVGEGNRALEAALVRHRRASGALIAASVPGLAAFALVVQAAFVVLVYLLTVWTTAGDISAASAVGLIVVTARFIDPVAQLAAVASATRRAGASIDRVSELLAVGELTDPQTAAVPADNSIVFSGTSFGYRTGSSIINDVDFTVAAGTTTAIVGPSGAGKTTLLRLAARFYDVQHGTVSIGGVDVRDMSLATVTAQVSPVFQDVYLFDQSIEDNIRVGRPDASTAEVREAARIAAVDEIVARLDDGWQTRVGERGANLSGGERQRISIARALLKDAPIVLLDEATSALDPHNEAVVVRGLRELTAGKTVVVVAHKLSTVAHADQILVVEDGRIVDKGTHTELASRAGRYADFLSRRDSARGWRLTAAR